MTDGVQITKFNICALTLSLLLVTHSYRAEISSILFCSIAIVSLMSRDPRDALNGNNRFNKCICSSPARLTPASINPHGTKGWRNMLWQFLLANNAGKTDKGIALAAYPAVTGNRLSIPASACVNAHQSAEIRRGFAGKAVTIWASSSRENM